MHRTLCLVGFCLLSGKAMVNALPLPAHGWRHVQGTVREPALLHCVQTYGDAFRRESKLGPERGGVSVVLLLRWELDAH